MAASDPRRDAQFPGIERRTGKPMSHWFGFMETQIGRRYEDQMETLRSEQGFTRAQANALIMYTKGSTSSRQVDTPEAYIERLSAPQDTTVRAILDTIHRAFPYLELVIAWNQPMFRQGTHYYFGVSAGKHHILIAPFDPAVLDQLDEQLVGLHRNKKTVRVPNDWVIDAELLTSMVKLQLASP